MTEAENKDLVRKLLEPHFKVVPEVWLREPISGLACRIDYLVMAPMLPFGVFGVEVKRGDLAGGQRRHALGQCAAYRRCVVVDRRLANLRGRYLPVVALYYGAPDPRNRQPIMRSRTAAEIEQGAEVRCFGLQNVGVLVHGTRGLMLEISEEPIWTERHGVTGVGVNWPAERIFANGTQRSA